MLNGHKNSDFFHDLPDFVFSFGSDALTSNLTVLDGIESKMNRSKRSASEAVWGDDISTDTLRFVGILHSCVTRRRTHLASWLRRIEYSHFISRFRPHVHTSESFVL